MKKVLIYLSCIMAIVFLSGCSMDNTPTKKTESFLNNYKNLDSTVLTQLDDVVKDDDTMSEEQKDKYKEILKKQYQDMTYTIKDEEINGDNATVTVEIEVYDLYKTTEESNRYYDEHQDEFKDEDDKVSDAKFLDYRIDQLDKATDKVKYTIDFTLTKVDNVWTMDDISNSTIQKIHGLYAY